MTLEKYHAKRHFDKTAEPRGDDAVAPVKSEQLSFVIQKHAARTLHYDFRLELDGTLKSWAVPKGPSLDPGEKRLAVHVEDHPVEYGSFEGDIPERQYGAGNVIVWDRGTWTPEGDPAAGYRKGHMKFRLDGVKLSGGWALVRMGKPKESKENWLLIKARDDAAREGREAELTELLPDSVLSGKAGKPAQPAQAAGKKAAAKKAPARHKRNGQAQAEDATVAGVRLSHPARVLFASAGVTKFDLARYYEDIADWILPHLAQRPLTLVRCPQGHRCFVQKHANDTTVEGVGRIEVPTGGTTATYMTAGTLPELVRLVQMGVLELHTWGARGGRLDRPDRIIFDLDPDTALEWKIVAEGALLVRSLLEDIGLASFVKTTGGKGLHVVAPLAAKHTWDEVKAFSKSLAHQLERDLPDRFIANMSKSRRGGRIFVDYLRNASEATAVAAYSTRAKPGAPVSTPLAWDELGDAKLRPDSYTVLNLRQRLDRLKQDPWAGYFDNKQKLTAKMLNAFDK